MRLAKFSSALLSAGVALFLTSCGSGGDKTSATDTTKAADTTAKAPPVNTIITTPQNVVVVMHKVANYDKWLTAYDAHDSVRTAAGLHNYVVARDLGDSNMVTVVLRVDDTAKAKGFEKAPGLKEAMKKAGVVGAPTMMLLTEAWQDTAKIETTLRSRSVLTCKDWDTFVKAFNEGKQERMDNGLMDRVLGHDLDDNKKVYIVYAMTDTAKAYAYFKSDALKKRREAGGVVGEPKRYFYRIAKHY